MKRLRRPDPHAENKGFLGSSGRKRIARGKSRTAQNASAPLSSHARKEHKPTIVIREPKQYILVCLHSRDGVLSNLDREVLYVGRVLAGRTQDTAVAAVIFGKIAADLKNYGADRVLCLDEDKYDGYAPEEKIDQLEKLIKKIKPEHILFGESDAGDSDLARRLAVRTQMSIAPGVIELDDETVRRFCDNGWQEGTHKLTDILVLNSGTAETDFDFETEAKPLATADSDTVANSATPAAGITGSMRTLSAAEVPLEEANFILAGGNGIKDFDKFLRLSKAMQASVGGSRVVVDDGKLPRSCQVGATGSTVNAGVYIAVGISGAVQHLQGIKDCRYVVAVNTDDSCDMVKRADLAVICDAGEWMDAMLELIGETHHKKQVA